MCVVLQSKGDGEGYHVPPSRGGLPPSQQGQPGGGGLNEDGPSSRGGLMTPSMKFTPKDLRTPQESGVLPDIAGGGGSGGKNGRAMTPRGAAAAGITVSAGVGFAPGGLGLPAAFNTARGATHHQPLKHQLSSSHPMHPGGQQQSAYQMQLAARLRGKEPLQPQPPPRSPGSYGTMVRPFSRGVESYLERVVGALLAADAEKGRDFSDLRKVHGITQVRETPLFGVMFI
eukprot:COSAG06_NODE_1228_length_10179_cov_3.735119_17_plen_229_part_00